MIKSFRNLLSLGLCASALVLSGCTGDDTGSTDTDAGTDTDATGGGAGFCALGCMEAADCCPAGAMDCPGDYPQNWECNDGVCSLGGCSNNDECTFGGALPDFECHEIGGVGACFDPCESDADCEMVPGTTCSGDSDDGAKYCAMESSGGCTSDDECGGAGVCNAESGACECSGDAECTIDGYVCKL